MSSNHNVDGFTEAVKVIDATDNSASRLAHSMLLLETLVNGRLIFFSKL